MVAAIGELGHRDTALPRRRHHGSRREKRANDRDFGAAPSSAWLRIDARGAPAPAMGERSDAPSASARNQSSFRNLRLRFNYRSQMSR